MGFELEIIKWLQSLRNDFLDFFFEICTMLGEEVVLILVAGLIYWCYDKKIGEKLGLVVFVSLGLNSVLKLIIARPRPFQVDSNIENLRPSTSTSYSMPSGHTQTASTLFFGVYYFIKKNWLLITAIIVTTLVAISRMYIGVHYLTDVLVGAGLGILIAYSISRFMKDKEDFNKLYMILLILTNIGLIGILVISYITNSSNGVLDAAAFYYDTESIAKMFGTISGFILGLFFEKKYVNFNHTKSLKKNIFRFILGIAVILIIRLALKALFGIIVDSDALTYGDGFKAVIAALLDYIRYLTMLLVGIGVYPILFRKLKFLGGNYEY